MNGPPDVLWLIAASILVWGMVALLERREHHGSRPSQTQTPPPAAPRTVWTHRTGRPQRTNWRDWHARPLWTGTDSDPD